MALGHFGMLVHESLNKDTYIVPEKYPLIILDIKSAVCMANNGKDAKQTRHISRIIHFVGNGESARCTKLIGVREVCNWQTLLPIMLVRII